MTYSSSAPPGWYPDPHATGVPGAERYWDGTQWTQMVRNAAVAPAYAPSPPGVPIGYGYGYGAPAVTKTNTNAIVSLVLSCVGLFTCGLASIPGVIFGHIARSQIRERHGREDGNGLAIAGLIIGYLTIIGVIVYFLFIAAIIWSWDDAGALSVSLSSGSDRVR